MSQTWLAITFALGAALTIAWGTVIRQLAAEQLPIGSVGRFGPILQVIRSPRWWGGTLLNLSGYALQAVALMFGSLLLVQPLLVLAMMFALPLSAHLTGRKISALESFWALLLTAGVVVLVIVGKPVPGPHRSNPLIWIVSIVIGSLIIWGLTSLGGRSTRSDKAMVLGVATGVVFGFVAVFTKASVDQFSMGGISRLVTTWELYALILSAIIGTVIQQSSFHAGPLEQSLPAMTVVEPITASVLGIAVLGEKFQAQSTGLLFLSVAGIVIAMSVVMLSRSEADSEYS